MLGALSTSTPARMMMVALEIAAAKNTASDGGRSGIRGRRRRRRKTTGSAGAAGAAAVAAVVVLALSAAAVPHAVPHAGSVEEPRRLPAPATTPPESTRGAAAPDDDDAAPKASRDELGGSSSEYDDAGRRPPSPSPFFDRLRDAAASAVGEIGASGTALIRGGGGEAAPRDGSEEEEEVTTPAGGGGAVRRGSPGGVGSSIEGGVSAATAGAGAAQEADAVHREPPLPLPRPRHPAARIERLAVLRPFGARMASVLPATFADWSDFLPCDLTRKRRGERHDDASSSSNDDDGDDDDVKVDLFLSFSQKFEDNPLTAENVRRVLDMFRRGQEEDLPTDGGSGSGIAPWAHCFDDVHVISASIPPERDLYEPSESERNPLWVNGPNRQFVASMEAVMGDGEEFGGAYDAMFVMEGDCVPVRQHWLDDLMDEAESGEPFAVLGSKYVGDSWDKFRSSLPLSLQHHLNGNAVYNTTHPLLRQLVLQLDAEADTPYNAVPYDYRLSQILVEGMLGVKPELPAGIVAENRRKRGGTVAAELEDNTDKFRHMWEEFGGDGVMRESRVISNYAGTNLLPRHVQDEGASIVHGAKHYMPWDPQQHNITLVVTEWHHELSLNLLSKLDSTDHPFSNVVLMVPQDLTQEAERHLSMLAPTSAPVTIARRHPGDADYMDLCSAPVQTRWFMITNAYHAVAEHVDLLFTPDRTAANNDGAAAPPALKPVLPYTPADERHCLNYPACREATRLAAEFYPRGTGRIVRDFDALFDASSRNDFCRAWLDRYGPNGERLYSSDNPAPVGPLGPTATSYAAYLASRNVLESTYGFTDRTMYGSRDAFARVFSEDEERFTGAGDGSALSNRILREGGGSTGLAMAVGTPEVGGAAGVVANFRRYRDALGGAENGQEDEAVAAAIGRTQIDPTLELRLLQDDPPGGVPNLAPTSSPVGEGDTASPTAAPVVGDASGSNSTSSPAGDETSAPTSAPVVAEPGPTPTPAPIVSTPRQQFMRCRSWCSMIPTPWFSTSAGVYPKCDWTYSCSSCDECKTV